jgi:hypothetical protein
MKFTTCEASIFFQCCKINCQCVLRCQSQALIVAQKTTSDGNSHEGEDRDPPNPSFKAETLPPQRTAQAFYIQPASGLGTSQVPIFNWRCSATSATPPGPQQVERSNLGVTHFSSRAKKLNYSSICAPSIKQLRSECVTSLFTGPLCSSCCSTQLAHLPMSTGSPFTSNHVIMKHALLKPHGGVSTFNPVTEVVFGPRKSAASTNQPRLQYK